jgi:hypothetical protein
MKVFEWPIEVRYDKQAKTYIAYRKDVSPERKSNGEVPIAWYDYSPPRKCRPLMTLVYITWLTIKGNI